MNAVTLMYFSVVVTVPSLGIMVLILDEITIPNLAGAFESAGPYSQLFVKIVANRLSLNIIQELLNEMEEKFWPIDNFGPKIQEKQLQIYRLFKYVLLVYIYTIYSSLVIITLRPLFMKERQYPLMTYNLIDVNYTPFFAVYYIVQVAGLFYAASNFLAIDGLFALFVVNVLSQIIMLRHGFASLNINTLKDEDEDRAYEKLKEYVEHHKLILNFIEKLSDLYSVQTFFQYVGNTASICMGVYIASIAGMDDISTTVRAITIVVTWFFQMAVYCIGGTLVTEACAKVADSIWNSGWEGPYRPKFRYATRMIIMQAQKPKIMKAGKIFDVNLASFTGVVRLSVSIYTLLNSVADKTA